MTPATRTARTLYIYERFELIVDYQFHNLGARNHSALIMWGRERASTQRVICQLDMIVRYRLQR